MQNIIPLRSYSDTTRTYTLFWAVSLNVLLLTPFIRPVRWQVLPFIYILPLIPLYIMWDGIASIFRTYSKAELNELISGLDNTTSFDWELGEKKSGPMHIYYLLGTPKK